MLSLLLLLLFSNVMRIFVCAFFFPNVNGIVSSSDISFLFVVPLVHSKWDFEGGAHSQTSLWTLERGFSWLIAAA